MPEHEAANKSPSDCKQYVENKQDIKYVQQSLAQIFGDKCNNCNDQEIYEQSYTNVGVNFKPSRKSKCNAIHMGIHTIIFLGSKD